MILTIHQPEFLPWLGYFHKMAAADLYVILDSVQYEKNYFQNRNKIRVGSPDGWSWITIPVLTKDRSSQQIREVELHPDVIKRQQTKIWKTIEQNYRNAPYFKQYESLFKDLLLVRDYSKLIDINLALITAFREILSIETPITLASELEITSRGSSLLLEICQHFEADTYLAGPHGRDYLDVPEFEQRGINVEFHQFTPPEYSQIHGEHVPYLSTLDLVFNHGPNSKNILADTN